MVPIGVTVFLQRSLPKETVRSAQTRLEKSRNRPGIESRCRHESGHYGKVLLIRVEKELLSGSSSSFRLGYKLQHRPHISTFPLAKRRPPGEPAAPVHFSDDTKMHHMTGPRVVVQNELRPTTSFPPSRWNSRWPTP
jgi:hypothetical protein